MSDSEISSNEEEAIEITAEDVLMAIVVRAVREPKKFDYDALLQVLREYECIDIIGDAKGVLLAEESGGHDVNEDEVNKLLKEIDGLELDGE